MIDILTVLSKHHNEWLAMVKSMGAGYESEDIVQDTYLSLHKWGKMDKIAPNGEVNKVYMFVSLRNTYLTKLRKKSKYKLVELSDVKELRDHSDIEQKKAQHRFDEKINEVQEDWHWYDKMFFNYYRESGKSLRKIEKETGISLSSLSCTLIACKKRLKMELQEDYEDLINEDYELI